MAASSSPVTRFFRALLTVWLTFILTQPVAVHACAMRNGTLSTVPVAAGGAHSNGIASANTMASAAARGDALAGMTAAMDHEMPSHSGTPAKCHCFGDCATTIPVALVGASYSLVPAPPHILAASLAQSPVERSFDEPTYLHPPATAPPIAIA